MCVVVSFSDEYLYLGYIVCDGTASFTCCPKNNKSTFTILLKFSLNVVFMCILCIFVESV